VKKQTYDLEERLLEYSVRIIKIVEQLSNTRIGNHVAGQLLKSGTSPYPNHGEAQAAERHHYSMFDPPEADSMFDVQSVR
jgi:hypothetical protein